MMSIVNMGYDDELRRCREHIVYNETYIPMLQREIERLADDGFSHGGATLGRDVAAMPGKLAECRRQLKEDYSRLPGLLVEAARRKERMRLAGRLFALCGSALLLLFLF